MSSATPALFDFSPYIGQSEAYVETIKSFAAGEAFRSAVVDELVLDNNYYRRPLRPEDFDFLKFIKPVRASTVSRLPSLASHRTLNSLYELNLASAPVGGDPLQQAAFKSFASADNRQYVKQLAPFLEAYAFEYLGNRLPADEEPATYPQRLRKIYAAEYAFWTRQFDRLLANDYLLEGLRFILIQRWCLAPGKRKVLEQTMASGYFDAWPTESAPDLSGRILSDDSLRKIASMSGVERQQHSYWQFYLATSLAKCNLLYALSRREGQQHALCGALYAAEAEWLAFESAVARACPHVPGHAGVDAQASERALDVLLQRFDQAVQHVQQQHGEAAVRQLGQGLAAGGKLAERGRWDIDEQLKWLSAIDSYCVHARRISRRIDAECPNIDRETFIEPRDMCSTTHVHNDHRLVTIEEGIMHFWGNLGMRLEMHPGDMVLIPDGRLHGSTVLSPECTYHQPIIPDDWVQELTGQVASAVAA